MTSAASGASPLEGVVMFLSTDVKDEQDARIRKDLRPELAELVISDNRDVRAYLIQREVGALKVADHCYTTGTHWETLKRVVCDWDDAIAYKESFAKEHGLDHTRLKLVREET